MDRSPVMPLRVPPIKGSVRRAPPLRAMAAYLTPTTVQEKKLEARLTAAVSIKPLFATAIEQFVRQVDGFEDQVYFHAAPVKDRTRILEKAEHKYEDDWGQVRDILRGAVILEPKHDGTVPEEELRALFDQALDADMFSDAKIEDHYSDPYRCGLRNFKLFFNFHGIPAEIQFYTKKFWSYASSKFDRSLYQLRRSTKDPHTSVLILKAQQRQFQEIAAQECLHGEDWD